MESPRKLEEFIIINEILLGEVQTSQSLGSALSVATSAGKIVQYTRQTEDLAHIQPHSITHTATLSMQRH